MAGKNSSLPSKSILTRTYTPYLSQFEFDTLRLCIPNCEISEEHLQYLFELINPKEDCTGKYEGQYKCFNIQVRQNTHSKIDLFKITITGSFSNYYVGRENMLPHHKLKEAVRKLSNELYLNLEEARLFRVDINYTFETEEATERYSHNLFTDLPRFSRFELDTGVAFKSISKALIFYNKSKQLNETKGIDAKNLYRVEFRITKGVKKELGIKTLEDLYGIENYHNVLRLFNKYLIKVKLQGVPKNMQSFESIKNFKDYLMLCGIEAKGGTSGIYKFVNQLANEKIFSSPKQKYRTRKSLTNLLVNRDLTEIHPLAVEVIGKFTTAYNKEILKKYNNEQK